VASAIAAGWAVARVRAHGTLVVALGDWPAPLGIELRVDGLSAVLLATTAVVGLVVSAFSVGWFPPPPRTGWSPAGSFWPLWLLVWGGLQATFVTTDLFNTFVTLELVTMGSVALVALPGGTRQVQAALRYFLAALVTSAAYLGGLALLYGAHSTMSMPLLAERVHGGTSMTVALVLITGGLALKTALFPFHFWLPEAHGSAPSPVSAVLSGLVIKAGFVVTVRVWLEVFPDGVVPVASQSVGVVAVVALLWGAWRALREERMKMVIAWSTVSQVGLLLLVVPVGVPGGVEPATGPALAAAGLLVVAHGSAKASLFLTAGALHRRAGGDELRLLAGAARDVPLLAVGFALAGASLIGLPRTAGYVGKSLLSGAGSDTGQWWWAWAIDLTAVVTALYVLRLAWPMVRRSTGSPTEPVSPTLQVAPLLLGAVGLLVGLWPGWLEELAGIGGVVDTAMSGTER
jgi:multicomponent Na+:H+ antiporter subunit D